MEKMMPKDVYYTSDYEWIDFQGSVAYAGVCAFKLTGFKEIQELVFIEPYGLKKQGEVIARIRSKDYSIDIHMPVDGKVLEMNPILVIPTQDFLLKDPEGSAWLVKLVPSQPYERKNLLLPRQYQLNGKSKFAK